MNGKFSKFCRQIFEIFGGLTFPNQRFCLFREIRDNAQKLQNSQKLNPQKLLIFIINGILISASTGKQKNFHAPNFLAIKYNSHVPYCRGGITIIFLLDLEYCTFWARKLPNLYQNFPKAGIEHPL